MSLSEQIKPISYFKDNAAKAITEMTETREPLIITQNGEATCVIQDIKRFKMHKDGPWHENGMSSRLTFLVYLSDDFTGGDTDFREFRISPQKGDALLFIHDTWHEGCAVQEGVKYVLRSDVLYR